MSNRYDPIRENYYKSLETIESISSWIFYFSAILSFVPLFIKKDEQPILLEGFIIAFCLSVILYAFLGISSRIYLFPRAEEARRKEFISTAMGIELIHERTTGYYNNNEEEPFQRLGMMLCENAFFTMKILKAMAVWTRWKTGIYCCTWLITLLLRKNSLDLISVATIVIFSEEILSRCFRLEWQRMKVENIYEKMRLTLQSQPTESIYKAHIVDGLVSYESAKAVGGILLSAKIFEQMNPVLTEKWERIKVGLTPC